jgi:hypothetical protein
MKKIHYKQKKNRIAYGLTLYLYLSLQSTFVIVKPRSRKQDNFFDDAFDFKHYLYFQT